MVKVEHLTKCYGGFKAVENLSFSVEEGEILGFLGPNGAGKTTTMNIMTGYISSTDGTVTVDGDDILESPEKAKSKIGYLPEVPPLYLDMKVREYLNFVFDLKKAKDNFDKVEHIDTICESVQLNDVENRLIKNLSKGYRQRVGIAQALIGSPKLLILDEPTVGLDPQQIIEIRNLIKRLGERHTIILSSHVLPEVQAICDRIIVINKGKLVADGNANDIADSVNTEKHFSVTIEGDKEKIYNLLDSIEEITNIKLEKQNDNSVEYFIQANNDIRRKLSQEISNAGLLLLGLKVSDMNLEELFCKLVDDSSNDVEQTDTETEENLKTENENTDEIKKNEEVEN